MFAYLIIMFLSLIWWLLFVHPSYHQWKMMKEIDKRMREMEKMFQEMENTVEKLERRE